MKPISSDGRHSGPTDLILRSAPLGARLEGWPLERPRLWPSFETRAKSALLWTRLMNGVDMLRTSETLHEAMTHPADQRVARSPPRAQRKAEQQFPDCASPIQAADLSRPIGPRKDAFSLSYRRGSDQASPRFAPWQPGRLSSSCSTRLSASFFPWCFSSDLSPRRSSPGLALLLKN